MLENFKQYSYYIPLAEEYFLYYGDEYVYRSTGGTLDLEWFLKTKIENKEERQRLGDEIEEMKENLMSTVGESRVFSLYNNDTYVLIPLKVRGSGEQDVAVLGFVVEKSSLYDRFQVVSGGMDGEMTLYGEETVLYSDGMEPRVAGQKGVLTSVSRDGCYRFCYQPEMKFGMQSSLFFQNLSLHLMGALLVIVISVFYSEKAYIPVKVLAEMYRGMVSEKSDYHENALEELKYMMDGIIQSNREFDSQIYEKQKMLRDQVLLRLIEGRISFEVMSCLDKAEICLPIRFTV